MRENSLSPSFIEAVHGDSYIINTVKELAEAIERLPSDTAERKIYHMLVTQSLGEKDVSQAEIELSLLELCRIRGEKGDEFASPTAKWGFLIHTEEYKAMAECMESPIKMGLIMHTIANYLKHNSINIDATVIRMKHVEEKLVEHKNEGVSESEQEVLEVFSTALYSICEEFGERYNYLCASEWGDNSYEFVKAFVALFILMANEPLVYVT